MELRICARAALLAFALAGAACTHTPGRSASAGGTSDRASAGATGPRNGEQVYGKACAGCHRALKPKLGDKTAWAPLLEKGEDALVESTINGKGGMPPKGGHKELSDEEVRAAVEYMIAQAK